MPAFLVILLLVVLVSWLGWWLLAIVGGLFAACAIWIYIYLDKSQITASQTALSDSYRYDYCQVPAHPARTVRSEIKSVSFGRKQCPSSLARNKSPLSNELRLKVALVVKDEPLERILSGQKTWEMRTTHTRKRETVALAKKGTGQIFGLADIIDSCGPLSDATMNSTVAMHGIDPSRLMVAETAKYRYAWVLANVRRLPDPIPYSHTKGAQSFILLDAGTSLAILAAAS